MDPLVEVVIHGINTNRIVYIKGNLSRRQIGDESLLDELGFRKSPVYPKINFDGKLVKSISVMLDDKYLMCINCDVSVFNKIYELSKSLLKTEDQPNSLFANDWQEKLHKSINSYLQNHNISFDRMNKMHKKDLVHYLFNLEAFHEKKAADYIAKVLDLGRATVFKYLREWRNK
jgi:predicted transcriptional regulator YheO